MKILTTSATLALLICNQSNAAYSIGDALSPFARSTVNVVLPEGLPRCMPEDLKALEAQLNICIPSELASFFMNFAHVGFTNFEVVLPQTRFHESTIKTITQAWDRGVPKNYLPFCRDSSEYYCIHLETGQVRFWSHDSETFSDNQNDMWDSFNAWVLKAWIPLMRE
jgi:hypothetical protein